MANLSTAEGTVHLIGATKSIGAFLELIEHSESWNYPIQIMDRDVLLEEINASKEVESEIEPHFFGVGRWNFEGTLTNFLKWFADDRENQVKWTTEKEAAWQQLNDNPITLTFTYVDYEETAYLVKEVLTITWQKNDIVHPQTTMNSAETFETTAENYAELADATYYDYSSFTVDVLKDPDAEIEVDWIDELKNSTISDQIDLAKFQQYFDTITKQLGRSLDQWCDENHNALWTDPSEWFDDSTVQDCLLDIMKHY